MDILGLILQIALFCFGFYIISKSADYFIDEASNIGKYFGMSKLLIGLTIVAIGTSLPEMITSLGSILFTDNYSQFIIGTTMGSNTTNILLAFGIFLITAKNFSIKKTETFNIISLLGTSIALTLYIIIGHVSYFAILLVIFYTYYLLYQKKYQKAELETIEEEIVEPSKKRKIKSIGIIILSFIGLFLGSKLTVNSIEQIGFILSIPAAYLTLTTVSIATSLPEIAVTISSAKKKEYLMAIGNIMGTNIMNICLIIGTSGFFGYYEIQRHLYISSTIIFIIATSMFAYLVHHKHFTKTWGRLFLILYGIYLITIFL